MANSFFMQTATLKKKPHPTIGWILFVPAICLNIFIVRLIVLWLTIKTGTFIFSSENIWELYGKLNFLGGTLIFLTLTLLVWGIYMLCIVTALVCPKPKISLLIYAFIMFLFAIGRIPKIDQPASIVNLIIDLLSLALTIYILFKGNIKNQDSYFNN